MEKDIRILVVDDYQNIRSLMVKHLKELGHEGEIIEACDGKEAVAVLTERNLKFKDPVDLIITDWHMPEMDGQELVSWAREQEALFFIPILMVTSKNEMDSVIGAIQSGVSNYIIKPWKVATLKEKITTCFANLRS